MTPVHAFTQKVELASDELHIVHCTFAVDKDHNVKFALIGDKVVELNDCILLDTKDECIAL